MPAHEEEAADAEREGVRINWLRTMTAFDGPQLQVEAMELDESGFPQPTGRFETLAADTVILALGQETESAFMHALPGVEFDSRRDGPGVGHADDGMPGRVRRGATWCPANALSRSAWGMARRPRATSTPGCAVVPSSQTVKHPSAAVRRAAPVVLRDAARRTQPELAAGGVCRGIRRGGRGSIVWTRRTHEAGRCLSCGNCFECDGCLRRMSGGRGDQAGADTGTGSTTTGAPDAARANEQCPVHAIDMFPEPAQCAPARRRHYEAAALGRLPAERGLLHLPDHPVVTHGRAGRRMVPAGADEHLGHRSRGCRDAERGRRGGRAARRVAGRAAVHDVHRLAGSAVDAAEHVQDRRRTDRRRDARGGPVTGRAGSVDLRRPLRCDGGAADRLRAARVGFGAGGPRPRPGRPGRHAAHAGAVRALLRRVPHLPRAATRSSCSPTRICLRWSPEELVRAHRGRALSPERPFIRGTAQNPDVYFQARETVNPFYARVPDVVAGADGSPRASAPGATWPSVEYAGTPQADRVLVLMGSGARDRRGDGGRSQRSR